MSATKRIVEYFRVVINEIFKYYTPLITKMMSQDLSIGNLTLEKVLTQTETDEGMAKLKAVNALLKEKHNMAMEKLPLEKLREEKIALEAALKYPLLNPSFLSMSNIIKYNGRDIFVPKFSVYGLDNNEFSMNIEYRNVSNGVDLLIGEGVGAGIGGVVGAATGAALFRTFDAGLYGGFIGIAAGGFIGAALVSIGVVIIRGERGELTVDFPHLPEIFSQEFIKSTAFYKYAKAERTSDGYVFRLKDIPRDIRKNYKETGNVKISSHLHGLIPTSGSESIRKALKTFPRKNLYLIAETKPDEWNVTKFIIDPIIVGINGEKCFYIDNFNTTTLEKYVKSEFKE